MKYLNLGKTLLVSIFFLVLSASLAQAAQVAVTGKALVLNTNNSYLDFTNYNSNVTVNDSTGNFSGYAFLEDIGWVAFGTTDNASGPVTVNLTSGAVTGSARALNTSADIDFSNYNSNVTINLTSGAFSGFAFSEDVGWLNFSNTGVTLASSLGDMTPPEPFSLLSPGDENYTHEERPIFSWRATTDSNSGLARYVLEIDNGETGDFSTGDIAPSGTGTTETTRYVIQYVNFNDGNSTNDEIWVYTKSSTDWGDSQNDGLLKEGRRTWTVKAIDSQGNERTVSRTLFVDRTPPRTALLQINSAPIAENMATTDTTPTIYGRATDLLAGDSVSNYVASGPKSIIAKIERKTASGTYTLHSLTTIQLSTSYWETTNAEIDDNKKNLANKYSPFTFTPKLALDPGNYRFSFSAVDNVDNYGLDTFFNLSIVTPGTSVVPTKPTPSSTQEPLPEPTTLLPDEVIEIQPEEPGTLETLISDAVTITTSWYWNVINFLQDGVEYLANLLQSTSTYLASLIEQSATKLIAFWQGSSSYLAAFTTQFNNWLIALDNSYQNLANSSTGVIGEGLLAIRNALITSTEFISSLFNTTGKFIANLFNVTGQLIARLFNTTSRFIAAAFNQAQTQIATLLGPAPNYLADFWYDQKVKVISIAEILFDQEPTIITDVRVVEVGETYAVITWNTNHYTKNNKVNYGQDLAYGQGVFSQPRAKEHRFTISGLKPNQKYFFEVMSENKNYVFDAYHEFTTLGDEIPTPTASPKVQEIR